MRHSCTSLHNVAPRLDIKSTSNKQSVCCARASSRAAGLQWCRFRPSDRPARDRARTGLVRTSLPTRLREGQARHTAAAAQAPVIGATTFRADCHRGPEMSFKYPGHCVPYQRILPSPNVTRFEGLLKRMVEAFPSFFATVPDVDSGESVSCCRVNQWQQLAMPSFLFSEQT